MTVEWGLSCCCLGRSTSIATVQRYCVRTAGGKCLRHQHNHCSWSCWWSIGCLGLVRMEQHSCVSVFCRGLQFWISLGCVQPFGLFSLITMTQQWKFSVSVSSFSTVTVFYKCDISRGIQSVSLPLIIHSLIHDLCMLAFKFYNYVTVMYAEVCAFMCTAAFLRSKCLVFLSII